ncbi:MAG: dTDP-4-dehydrorhamnose 3,5-epimerase [Candidatus Magasanikbacteria bacterium]|jgi:dTDP-4-dehydrorhamnose 3,5-epimerase|nr:dTDP-4-dehydrorhamnose 3,5-epimerase [Candidatus Magasanikbacteria bacterium]MBT4314825.1 dTDP-4-dehydrorhamnose 3,5-epimerase [Candidatus Magasanikbacteria bacterium]MBT4547602.1 dTDP-4-dehydrorhamnose 3,5-epimerase [Candidatus Magasanikbacteria bacterium]MBT6819232.1 dTDP-4-dehydrorhamnose 3,5-epimerase [Candidatus Magasanikbacteria bacterium]
MKLIEVKQLELPGVQVIRFGRFADERGYFSEILRKSDIKKNKELGFLKDVDFVQFNENFSKAGVLKGLHFQWEPALGKLIRTVSGHMVDIMLDIRKGSPTEGKIILYDMPFDGSSDYGEWLWLPPGIAHGSFFLEDSTIEYFFSGDYNPEGEAGISPLSKGIDWALCDKDLKKEFDEFISKDYLMGNRDKHGLSLQDWSKDIRSENFIYNVV